MRNVLSETLYSLKKRSLFNIILIILFALLFWLLTLVMSYYLDMPADFGSENIVGKYAYYTFVLFGTEDDMEEFSSQSSDVEYVDKMKLILNEVLDGPEYTFMSVRKAAMTVDHDFFMSRLDDKDTLDFTVNSLYPGYLYKPENYDPELLRPLNVGYSSHAIEPSVYRIDKNAMGHFGVTAADGRLFSDDDFLLGKNQTEIPILLGHAYRPYFEIGETFEIYYCGTFQARVIGFLEENTAVVTDQILPIDGHPMTFDYSMIVPLFHIQSEPENRDEKTFAEWNYDDYLIKGFIMTDKDVPRSQVIRIEKQINAAFVKHGLYPIYFMGSPYGLDIFKKESEQTVAILLSLVLIMAIFSVFCICLCLITKIDRNLCRYAIQIMNGQSIAAITTAFIAEIWLIICTSMSFALSMFWTQIRVNKSFLFFIVSVSAMIAIIISTVIVVKLRGLDVEELIRRSE